jgi:hypothetical protein
VNGCGRAISRIAVQVVIAVTPNAFPIREVATAAMPAVGQADYVR